MNAESNAPALPIAPGARDRLALGDDPAFAGSLADVLSDLATTRRLALRLAEEDGAPVRAGALYAFGLLHAYQGRLIGSLGGERLLRAVDWLSSIYGAARVQTMLEAYRLHLSAATGAATGTPPQLPGDAPDRRPIDRHPAPDDGEALGGLMLLWLANGNPAAQPFSELVDDSDIEAHCGYRSLLAEIGDFFSQDDPEGLRLYSALLAPVRSAPDDAAGQLRAVIDAQRPIAAGTAATSAHPRPQADADRELLRGLDVLREERKPGFVPGPPPPPEVPDFAALAGGEARYGSDRGWMDDLVIVAKNVLVWLDQLSRQYQRTICRLDEIPDDELADLRSDGITSLWLIGIWRRSRASARIKQLCGNPEAAASAYAVDDYVIDQELGGNDALAVLEQRAAVHGIRLACDMVPNHMGLDSRWVMEHPERFLQVETPPFPGYRFDGGPDLSDDPRVALHLETGYYERQDAAVVFRRTDRATGEASFLYHGNDGTSLPWNDTAQLDFSRAETREAVIEAIKGIARRFPIIRFDAAMTLAKQHVQRLWFPLPGKGGDVPSRAEHALEQAELDALMPEEFWIEVVERIAAEVPGTLLLAEAFWLMESYFVRNLGMHRVYNSAFMHMLGSEDNARFHRFVAEALAFNPQLIGRFVNFLTNPDEAPAAERFGRSDKYFAAATLLATFPGTPLVGHGQVAGLGEKYGMEYRRAYGMEHADTALIERHRSEIVPLLARRAVLAGIDGFELYEVELEAVELQARYRQQPEDVIAFSNRTGGARAIILVHNRGGTAQGRLLRTMPRPRGDDAETSRLSIADALGIPGGGALRGVEHPSGHPIRIEHDSLTHEGLRFHLGPYERIVLLDLIDVSGEDEIEAPTPALRRLLEPSLAHRLLDLGTTLPSASADDKTLDGVRDRQTNEVARARLEALAATIDPPLAEPQVTIESALAALDAFVALLAETRGAVDARAATGPAVESDRPGTLALLAWSAVHTFGQLPDVEDAIRDLLRCLGAADGVARRHAATATFFLERPHWYRELGEHPAATLAEWLEESPAATRLLGRHEHDGVVWITQDGIRTLIWWLGMSARIGSAVERGPNRAHHLEIVSRLQRDLNAAVRPSEYRWRALYRTLTAPADVDSAEVEDSGIEAAPSPG